jgi:hypothetical protein
MNSLTVNDAQCAALFVSGLQRSDALSGDAVAQAATRAVRQFGVRGCAGLMAQEFGDHPEAAMDRMQWIRQLLRDLSASPTSQAGAAIAA